MFEAWKGLDRTSGQTENEEYSFSDDNYNIEQGKLVKSEKTKANYIFVGGTAGIIAIYKAKPEKTSIEVKNMQTMLDEAHKMYDGARAETKELLEVLEGVSEEDWHKKEQITNEQSQITNLWHLDKVVMPWIEAHKSSDSVLHKPSWQVSKGSLHEPSGKHMIRQTPSS